MNKLIVDKFYHPVVYFFLLALLSLLLGSVFALQYKSFNIFSIIIFYFYISINQLTENLLLRIPNKDFHISKKLLFVLEMIILSTLLFFNYYHSSMVSLLLFLYTLTIQLQFLFSYYDLDEIAILITSCFKVILLNGLAFYIHTNFIHYNYFLYFSGILLPYIIYEITRLNKTNLTKKISLLTILSYILAIILLSLKISYFALILLLTLPFSLLGIQKYTQKKSATFLIVFSTVYTVLLIFSFLT